jgi:hypothetical protein
MDRNVVLLSGTVAAVGTRAVGQQGRTLTELRINVARPVRKDDAEQCDLIAATIWSPELGAAVQALAVDTAVTLAGRLTSREWNGRHYLELVGDSVRVDVLMLPAGEPVAAARPAARLEAPPAPASRGRESEVPF